MLLTAACTLSDCKLLESLHLYTWAAVSAVVSALALTLSLIALCAALPCLHEGIE
jgi:hypothetical protein